MADGRVDAAEAAFLDRVCARLGIAPEERASLTPIADRAEAAAQARALPPPVQAEAMDLLVAAAAADGKVVPEEQSVLVAVAHAMGLSVRDVVARLAQKIG